MQILLSEDWSKFKVGRIPRDETPRGEYMAMLVPDNPNGWYHNCRLAGVDTGDKNMSGLEISRSGKGHLLKLGKRTYSVSAIVFTTGEKDWRNFKVEAQARVLDDLPVGIVARYRTNRDFYGAVFESGIFKIVRMLEGSAIVLASMPFKLPCGFLKLSLEVQGAKLIAKAGEKTLSAEDGAIASGGFGLWINGPAEFSGVEVSASDTEIRRLRKDEKAYGFELAAKRKQLPAMRRLASFDIKERTAGRHIRFADLDGDGQDEILLGVPTMHKGKESNYDKLALVTAFKADGTMLWECGEWPGTPSDYPCDTAFQAADRGNGVEVVASFGDDLCVIDGRNGKIRKKVKTPVPPKMEPFWDEIQQFFGSGKGDDLPHLITDSLRLCNLTGLHPYGDILVKDRYHNLWALDGKSMKILWHHQCNLGHFPFTCDFAGKGVDEVIAGYSRLDNKGRLTGRLFLGDHPDAGFAYIDHAGLRHNMHPAGDAGLIDETADWRVQINHLGHVQHLSVANFIPELPGLERIIVTYHFNENIIVLLDSANRIIRKKEAYGSGAVCQPVNWTGDGRELIAFSPKHDIGGLWNADFDLVVPFPDNDRPGMNMEAHDILGLGVDQIIVWDRERLDIYAPETIPNQKGKKYSPLRPFPNMSNYQVNYSLPRWE